MDKDNYFRIKSKNSFEDKVAKLENIISEELLTNAYVRFIKEKLE